MNCPHCGRVIPGASRFCNLCGVSLSAGAASLSGTGFGDEEIIFVLRPSLIFVVFRYILAALLTGAAAGVYWALHTGSLEAVGTPRLPWWTILIVGGLAVLPAIYRHIMRQREVYSLTNHKIEFTYGLVSKLRRNIPLRNVQDVTVTQSFMERVLGVGDIVIDSAAQGGKIPLRNIHDPGMVADMILQQIQRHQR